MNEKKIYEKKVMPQRGLELGTSCVADESANQYTMGSKYFGLKLNKTNSTWKFKKDHETVLTARYSSLCVGGVPLLKDGHVIYLISNFGENIESLNHLNVSFI